MPLKGRPRRGDMVQVERGGTIYKGEVEATRYSSSGGGLSVLVDLRDEARNQIPSSNVLAGAPSDRRWWQAQLLDSSNTCSSTIEVDGYGTLHCNRQRVASVRKGGGPGLGPHKTHMAEASPLAHPTWPPNWFQWVNSQDVGPVLTRQGRQQEPHDKPQGAL